MTKGAMTQKIWMTRDIKAAELFQTCCNVKMENAMRYTGVTEERLCTWKKMGYIVDVYEDKRSYLQTTEKGRAKFEEITGKRPYFCQSYPHDEALAEVRSSLSDTERAS